MDQTAKPFWASRTIWANLFMVAGVVLESTGVTDVMTPDTQEIALAAVMGVVNLILRFVTTDPIEILSAPSSST